MSYSNYQLNQKIQNLQSQIDNLVPPSGGFVPVNTNSTINDIKTFTSLPQCTDIPTLNEQLVNKLYVDTVSGTPALSAVLTAGDNAGGLNITNLNNLDVTTINGSAYPPATPDLTAVLTAGNSTNLTAVFTNGTDTNTIASGSVNITDGGYSTLITKDGADFNYNSIGVSNANVIVDMEPNYGNISVSFNDISSGATSQTYIKSQFNQTEISVSATDGLNTATRNDITIGGACLDTHTATNGVLTANHIIRNTPSLGSSTLHQIDNNSGTVYNSKLEATSTQTYLLGQSQNPLVDNSFSAFSTTSNAGISSTYQTYSGTLVVNQGAFNQTAGSSECLVSSAGITAGSSQLLRLETPLVGDAILEHQYVGATPRNFGISTNGNMTMTADNIDFSTTGRLIIPTLVGSYLDFNPPTGRLTLQNSVNAGGSGNPQLVLQNTNASAGSVAIETYKNRTSAQNDTIYNHSIYAKNYLGNKTEYARISSVITNTSAGGGDDGSINIWTAVNGTVQNVFTFNGADNENNTFRPLDLTGNELKTSSGNLLINAGASTGTGHIILTPKTVGGEIQVNKPITNPTGQIDIIANTNINLVGNFNTVACNSQLDIQTPILSFTGGALQSGTSSGNSGQHLVITLNGVVYKIKLELP